MIVGGCGERTRWQAGGDRRARVQPGYRGHQVRRLRLHRVVLDARRGGALRRRLRQPGAAARSAGARRAGSATPSTRSATAASATSTPSSCRSCCSPSASLFALYEGIHKIQHPHPVTAPAWAFGVLAVAIVLESLSFRTAITRVPARSRAPARGCRSSARSKAPELPVVLLEDTAALIGLVLAFGGVDCVGGHRRRRLGRRRHAGDRRPARRRRDRAGGRDQEPADRRERRPGGGPADRRRAAGRRRRRRGSSTCARCTWAPTSCSSRRRSPCATTTPPPQVARGIDAAECRVRAAVPIARVIYLEPDLDRTPAPPPALIALRPPPDLAADTMAATLSRERVAPRCRLASGAGRFAPITHLARTR